MKDSIPPTNYTVKFQLFFVAVWQKFDNAVYRMNSVAMQFSFFAPCMLAAVLYLSLFRSGL